MISQDRADAAIEDAARSLLEMTYDQLNDLSKRVKRKLAHESWEISVDGEPAYVSMMIGEIGCLRKRVCVELVLGSECADQWAHVPCVYFERFKSGRLYVARASAWHMVAVYALLLAGITFVALVVLHLAKNWAGP